MPSLQRETIRVLVLGDANIGKTSLVRTLAEGSFPTADLLKQGAPPDNEDCPEYHCNHDTAIVANDISYSLHLLDPPSESTEVHRLLKAKNQRADVCYLCFDMTSPASFKRIKLQWKPLLEQHKYSGHLYLVGLKEDLTNDVGTQKRLASEGHEPISDADAKQLANEIDAFMFFATSSLKYLGIQNMKEHTVFNTLGTKESTKKTESRGIRCAVM